MSELIKNKINKTEQVMVQKKQHLATAYSVLKDVENVIENGYGVDQKCEKSPEKCSGCEHLFLCIYNRLKETTPDEGVKLLYFEN